MKIIIFSYLDIFQELEKVGVQILNKKNSNLIERLVFLIGKLKESKTI